MARYPFTFCPYLPCDPIRQARIQSGTPQLNDSGDMTLIYLCCSAKMMSIEGIEVMILVLDSLPLLYL